MAAIIEEDVRDALRHVIDPELGINVVDLGLVYGVEIQGAVVRVRMTMTTPACPLSAYLSELAQSEITSRLPAVQDVIVELVWDPPWDADMMSPEAQRRLGY